MSYDKERAYQAAFKPMLKLLKGLDVFLAKADEKAIPMAIGSAAIHYNIDFVLDGLELRKYFPVIVGAEDVVISKPHPETYLKCADQLQEVYANCIVFEDSPKGVEAAHNAGMKAVVLTTMHTAEEFSGYDNVIAVIKDYTDQQLNNLFWKTD